MLTPQNTFSDGIAKSLNPDKYGFTAVYEPHDDQYLLYWEKDGVIVYAERGLQSSSMLQPVKAIWDPEGELEITEENKDYLLANESPLYSEDLSLFARPASGQVYPKVESETHNVYKSGHMPTQKTIYKRLKKDGTPDGKTYSSMDEFEDPSWIQEPMDPLYIQKVMNYVWLYSDKEKKNLVYELIE